MYKNPRKIVEQGIVTGIINDDQIQPNAIDFSVDKLFKINATPFYLSNKKSRRVMRTLTPVEMTDSQTVGHIFGNLNPETIAERVPGWLLEPGMSYEGTSNMYVEVPEGMAAILKIKSTLNRNAMKMISGIYDSGFKGNIGYTIHNPIGYTFIELGALVGQIAFVESESVGLYAGGYNTENGQHWTELPDSPIVEDNITSSDDQVTDPVIENVPEVETVAEAIVEPVTEVEEVAPTVTPPAKPKKIK